MTDTAKPTPGPWAINTGGQIYSKHPSYDTQTIAKIDISCLPTRAVRNYGDADLICEAGTVYHETNLTPRQLLERVRELEELVEDLLPYAKAAVPFPVAVGEPTVFERAEAALAKHGEGV